MGCCSCLGKKCGRGIQSTCCSGQQCHLFVLKNGKVIEKMSGQYNSYGQVFIEGTQREDVKHSLKKSEEWKMDWGDICDLQFNGNEEDGVAAYHDKCYDGEIPTEHSEGDPNQGWGEDGEDFGDTSDKYDE